MDTQTIIELTKSDLGISSFSLASSSFKREDWISTAPSVGGSVIVDIEVRGAKLPPELCACPVLITYLFTELARASELGAAM